MGCGEEHAVGLEAAHLAGGEVGDDDDAASNEIFRGVPLGDAGEDLTLFVAEVDLEAEEFVGLGDALGDEDAGDAEVYLGEVVDGDLGEVVGRRRGGGGRELLGDGVHVLGSGVQGRGGGERGDGGLGELGLGAAGGVAVVGDVRESEIGLSLLGNDGIYGV